MVLGSGLALESSTVGISDVDNGLNLNGLASAMTIGGAGGHGSAEPSE